LGTKKGEFATNTKDRAEMWEEYFDKLLNTEDVNKTMRNLKK